MAAHAPAPAAAARPPAGPPLRDRVMRVATPEAVDIEYPLAGLGSRFAALLLDLLCIAVLGMLAALAVAWAGMVAILAVMFLAFWGWFFAFEAFRDGQTPGKRALGLRVVMEGGYPLTWQAAAIRNLIRAVDVQPGVTCLLGGFVMLLDGQARRLGDMAAGTVVVRDAELDFPEVVELPAARGVPRLSDAEFAALEAFVDRAADLARPARNALASKLCERLPREILPLQLGASRTGALRELHADESARRQAARLALGSGSASARTQVRARRSRWLEFRKRVRGLTRRGLAALDEEQVSEFAAEYRAVSADLARARTYGASPATLYALERLAGRAHNLFYRPGRSSLGHLRRWLTGGFPRLVRRRWIPVTVAAVVLYAPALLVFLLMTADPELEGQLADGTLIARAERATEPGVDYRDTWEGAWLGSETLSGYVIVNNVWVSFYCFAGGALAGLGSLLLLVFNGVHLGSALAVFANRGVLDNIGLFVMGHGVIELTAIAIAGGAGLWMGSAFLLPGRRTRLAAFAVRAREGLGLLGGVVFMLVVAGLIEGFVSPARFPAATKLLVAAVAALATAWYLLVVGRVRADGDELTARRGA